MPFHYQQLSKVDFELVVRPNWAGIQKQRIFAGADTPVEAPHPLIFPNILFVPVRTGYALHIRTPIDDSNTQVYQFRFSPTKDGSIAEQTGEPPIESSYDQKAAASFTSTILPARTIWPGKPRAPIANRSKSISAKETAASSCFANYCASKSSPSQNGEDPVGMNRDPAKDEMIQLIQEGY